MKRIKELGISPMPWRWQYTGNHEEIYCIEKDGTEQAIFAWTKDVINKKTPQNADLMAAAPELYDALQRIVDGEDLPSTWAMAKRALIKAGGMEDVSERRRRALTLEQYARLFETGEVE